ncbi:hypothetical protein HNQ41_002890 [Texcoconibacillus texcoconensis]|uniref:Uncharacterized protein n=1 Tax=Texcoconibacillus texcoconensis TaxID=1095777 RepID=A0A840QTN2_9BACI|nr:hypothetical protein [Texcoconibacillus texcoconensis]
MDNKLDDIEDDCIVEAITQAHRRNEVSPAE